MSDSNISSYRKLLIPKNNGKYRCIYIPNHTLKSKLYKLLPTLKENYYKNIIFEYDHAFVSNKNCATNAILHVHNRYVLSMDIENFFDSITKKHLQKYLNENILELVLVNNRLAQGFPTSPILANIAMIKVDEMIIKNLNQLDGEITYSRYADDLTFSFNKKDSKNIILHEINKIFRYFDLKVNQKKTKFYDKNNGRAIITGIGVSYYTIHPTRKTLKKLRAAKHQNVENSIQGLLEWSACKLPKEG